MDCWKKSASCLDKKRSLVSFLPTETFCLLQRSQAPQLEGQGKLGKKIEKKVK